MTFIFVWMQVASCEGEFPLSTSIQGKRGIHSSLIFYPFLSVVVHSSCGPVSCSCRSVQLLLHHDPRSFVCFRFLLWRILCTACYSLLSYRLLWDELCVPCNQVICTTHSQLPSILETSVPFTHLHISIRMSMH